MLQNIPLLLSLLVGADFIAAQTPSTSKVDEHPSILTYECTKAGGCKKQTSYIVLDEDLHPKYQKNNPSLGCGSWGSAPNKTVCPDEETCAKNCVIDPLTSADYAKLGVKTQGTALHLDMLRDSDLASLSPRVYLLDNNREAYTMLKLTGNEFSFNVDVSKLPCGMNGALYLSEMHSKGGMSPLNKVGAKLGGGYCDAQCFTFPFLEGVGNIEGKGACCNGMLFTFFPIKPQSNPNHRSRC
jgi:cellulase